MSIATRRFIALAGLLLIFVLGGLVSLPLLQQCCPDAPLPDWWPEPSNPSLLDRLFFMDMAPRLAALAVAAGLTALVALTIIYAVTVETERRENEGRSLGSLGLLRAVAAAVAVGVLYLYGFFVTGYFQLGWFNLIWILGVPALLAALTGRDEFECRWGGAFLIIPGFVAMMVLMMALGIDVY
ncbi:hypothetical protein [Sphingomonas daechungensis]|uniref:hypothetical protein n=1 Tax=Sphingomonas daechungensis TaxID=1176646 RepID=UPI00378309B7